MKPVKIAEVDALMAEWLDKGSHCRLDPFEEKADCSELTARSVNYTWDNWKEVDLEPSIRGTVPLMSG
jgi:hypothetical protein